MAEEKKNVEIPTLESQHYHLIFKDIDQSTAQDAMTFILERNLMRPKPPEIRLIICSSGGDLEAAFALIDMMEASSVPIYTYGLGALQSAALSIFITGARGHRYITKNTSILSHQFSWATIGKAHEMIADQKEVDLITSRVFDHYKKHTKQPKKVINEILLPPHDVWLSAREAVEYGLADKIMKGF